MPTAIRNFVMVTVGLLFFTCTVWVVLRLSAQSQPVAPPLKHPFLNGPLKSIVAYHLQGPGTELEKLERASKISKDLVIWIDTRAKRDGTMVAAFSDDDAEKSEAPLLKDAIEKFPANRIIVNFRGNREGMIQAVAKSIEDAHAAERVLVQSPEDGFLKTLREGKAEWLYGTSAPALTRFVMLSSIGLESLAPLKGDVIVIEASAKEHTIERMSESLINEAHRRSMKIYAGPAETEQQALAMWNGQIDGVLTEQPEQLWALTHKP
jgi:hypothetical protein